MYVLPRCIDKTCPNGERTEGVYNDLLTEAIGKGAYDQNGFKNAVFLTTEGVGPYPEAMRYV